MRKRVPKRVLNMEKNPINIQNTVGVNLTRATRLNEGHIERPLEHYCFYPLGPKLKKSCFSL